MKPKQVMSISIKNLDRICLAIVILVSGVCTYWVVSEGANKKADMERENDLFKMKLETLDLADSRLTLLKKAVREGEKELKTLNERISESDDIGVFLQQVHGLMEKWEIHPLALQPMPRVNEKYYTRIPIRLILKGGFINIHHLLFDLETMNRILVLDHLTISTPDSDLCTADMEINIFESSPI
jgi:Tfp pilus assembly protein PilO